MTSRTPRDAASTTPVGYAPGDLLKARLNGARHLGEHPGLPLSPAELVEAACGAVSAGANALHVHPRDPDGAESLLGEHIDSAVAALREAFPGMPLGVSTGAWIEPDVGARVAAIESWTVVPDFASLNFDEDGALEVASALRRVGVWIEAGLSRPSDVDILLTCPELDDVIRALLEPDESDGHAAWDNVRAIDAALHEAAIDVPRLAHATGDATWTVLRAARAAGFDRGVGFEDTLTLPDGTPARDNAALVRAVVYLDDP